LDALQTALRRGLNDVTAGLIAAAATKHPPPTKRERVARWVTELEELAEPVFTAYPMASLFDPFAFDRDGNCM
jgi:hypothetical protein